MQFLAFCFANFSIQISQHILHENLIEWISHCSCIVLYLGYMQVWSFISKSLDVDHQFSVAIFPGLMWWQNTLIHQVLSRPLSMRLRMFVSCPIWLLCSHIYSPSFFPPLYSKLVSPWINTHCSHRNCQRYWSIVEETWVDMVHAAIWWAASSGTQEIWNHTHCKRHQVSFKSYIF